MKRVFTLLCVGVFVAAMTVGCDKPKPENVVEGMDKDMVAAYEQAVAEEGDPMEGTEEPGN